MKEQIKNLAKLLKKTDSQELKEAIKERLDVLKKGKEVTK